MSSLLIVLGLLLVVAVATAPLLAMRNRQARDKPAPAAEDVGHEPTVGQDPFQPPDEQKGATPMTRNESIPPMNPHSDEASVQQLELARVQGDAYGQALEFMTGKVAQDGGQQRAGDYLVGYAVEKAEGMYQLVDGELVWREPEQENLHLEITVRDAADGRFVPQLTVHATLIAPDGQEVGTHRQPLLWHPMLYHYGRNWQVPADGRYGLRVRIDPPAFMRHDHINGVRFSEPVEATFDQVEVHTGQG